MADALKKGIGTKYLLPIVAVYVGAVTLAGTETIAALQTALQRIGIAGVAGLFVLVIQELLPRSAKEVLIFWRLHDRLPGCRAFSEIAKRDSRIDQALLQQQLASSAMTGAEQNAIWYKWLSALGKDPAIADNHYRFLVLRDSAVLLFMLACISPFDGFLPIQSLQGAMILTGGCAVAYLLTMVAARNAAVRLVSNVIARKLSVPEPSPRKKPRSRKF